MLNKLFHPGKPVRGEGGTILVVSGLPRSGTSMMMKMLAEGGIPVVSDAIRTADEDNPNGYFEFEPVKKMAEGQTDWLREADHKVVKVISALLEYLPAGHRYKILFMEREIREILASQHKMLLRRNEDSKTGDAEMEAQFRKHLSDIKFWLARQPNMEVLYVDYNRLMSDPGPYCREIAEFTGMPVDVDRMRSVPDAQLYRNRAASKGPANP